MFGGSLVEMVEVGAARTLDGWKQPNELLKLVVKVANSSSGSISSSSGGGGGGGGRSCISK